MRGGDLGRIVGLGLREVVLVVVLDRRNRDSVLRFRWIRVDEDLKFLGFFYSMIVSS